MALVGLHLFNDLHVLNGDEVLEKVQANTHLSYSFIALLIGSSIITTLGLLLNQAPIVIGGMIISPLMWPLVKIGLGVSYSQIWYIRHALILLVLSIVITLLCSVIITFVSPIKAVTDEIVTRTTPTLLDLIVAVVAGGIAALAITRSRISDSLAGVAIATALMPPLCVAGIGLALFDLQIFSGSFLLFFANVIAIIFTATIVFNITGIRRTTTSMVPAEGFLILIILLVVTAAPLYFLLRDYTFKTTSYTIAQKVLAVKFSNISPLIQIGNIKTNVSQTGKDTILVEADVFLPEDATIDFVERQKIIDTLQSELGKPVDLRLRLQRTIAILSEEDIEIQRLKEKANHEFEAVLTSSHPSFTIDSIDILIPENRADPISLLSVLRGDPSLALSTNDLLRLEKDIESQLGRDILLSLEIIPRAKLKSLPEIENERIIQDVTKLLETVSSDIEVDSVSLTTEKNLSTIRVNVSVKATSDRLLTDEIFDYIGSRLEDMYDKPFIFNVTFIQKRSFIFN